MHLYFIEVSSASFFKSLSLLTLLTSGVLWAIHRLFPDARTHGQFAAATILLFVVICISLYFAGINARQSSNKYAFSNIVSVSVFGKMVIAMGFLLAYQQLFHPVNQWFVGIFLFCYVVYTSFEVWFMTRLGK